MRDADEELAAEPASTGEVTTGGTTVAAEVVAAERRRTAALAAVAQALYAGQGLADVLSLALRCAAAAMGAADGSLFLFEGDDRTRLRGVAELLPLDRIDLVVELAASPGRLRALTERRAVLISRDQAAGDEVTWFRRSGARWSITAPLCVGSRPLGLLLLNSCAAHPPDEGDLELALLVAGQCAVAIDRAQIDEERERLLREVREQAEKLREDVAALEDLQERREDLVRTISHDLRTPLTSIHGQAQLLLKRAGGSEQVRQGAAAILTSANRMNVLIQDLVDMTRAEIGHIRLETRPVCLLPFLEELRERFRWVLEMDRLRFEVPADLPPLAADPGRLERILLNLLTNALKYSQPGTEVVVRGADGGGSVAIAVEDRGQGIAPEDLPRIFDRFYRSGRVLRKTEGLGLGLYISRLLVEAMGGTLEVESELDRGSVFTARFPAA